MMYKMRVAYNGKNYSGFQIQKNANTIEEELRKACTVLFRDEYKFYYSSRTDAGVHALGQVIAVHVETMIPIWKIPHAINAQLPDDIVVQDIEEVKETFHPRYNAVEKTYRYRIYNHRFMNPLHNEDAFFVYEELDIDQMQKAAGYFIGKKV